MKTKDKNKYWICEFFRRSGEEEYSQYYIYSDKNLKDMGYENDKDDYKILSQFYLHKLTPDDEDGGSYWYYESLVEFRGMEEVNPSEFETLKKVGVYVNGDELMFDYEKAA